MCELECPIKAEPRSFKNDNKFGLDNESIVGEQLKVFFKDYEMEKTKDMYCAYDFESPRMKYELKSRRCTYEKFLTTIVPVHKIKKETNICFVFKFTNGLFYIYYDAKLFEEFKIKIVSVFRDGFWGKPVPHFEIPTDLLNRIDI